MAEMVDRIVAVVNGEIVTASELNQAMAMRQRGNKGAVKESAESSRSEVLDKLIDELLLKDSIEKAKITVDDEEVARAIGNVLRQNQMTPEQLKADLASKGVTYETYKYQVAHQIRFIKFTNQIVGQQIKLSDRELRDYYDRNKDRFGGPSSTFEAAREQVYDALYEERMEDAMRSYLLAQRQKAYIDIR
jgi:peptidyl-prolyl cis-trans isomerase SurA